MSDGTDEIQQVKNELELFIKNKFIPLSTDFKADHEIVAILGAERGENAKIKWAQKLVDDLEDQLEKRIKALEDKVTALQKKK